MIETLLFVIVVAGGMWSLKFSAQAPPDIFDFENPPEPKDKNTIELKKLRKKKKIKFKIKYRDYLNSLFDYDLTEEQLDAVLNDSRRSLVIASAGSGKSSTIVAKYAFLLKSKLAKPEEILVLAFNKTVQKELKEKIDTLLHIDSQTKTFHATGNEIIELSQNKKQQISKLSAEDDSGLLTTKNMEIVINEAKKNNNELETNILLFRALTPYQKIENFVSSIEEYEAAITTYPFVRHNKNDYRSLTIPTISGDFVKSQQELAIANYLTILSISFEYEKPIFDSDLERDIEPDFYYPDIDLFHEHFAIDKNGEAPHFFENYYDDMQKKKAFYERKGIDVFYTYSYEFSDGTIFKKLIHELRERGQKTKKRSNEEIEKLLSIYVKNDTYKLIRTVIKLAKSNYLCPNKLEKIYSDLYKKSKDKLRLDYFRKIIKPIYESYQKLLEQDQRIDFEDMVSNATSAIKNKEYLPKYKYILVDEFQDISKPRLDLMSSLSGYKAKIFAVGDDWQSIYRFTGSDITELKSFSKSKDSAQAQKKEKKFITDYLNGKKLDYKKIPDKDYSLFKIQTNFRTEESINTLSSTFIQKNPLQIKKDPKTLDKNKRNIQIANDEKLNKWNLNYPIAFGCVRKYSPNNIKEIIDCIPKSKVKKEVLILGRAGYQVQKDKIGNIESLNRNDISIKATTIHKIKGGEADIVIMLGNDNGLKGFPYMIDDDPLLLPLLPEDDSYENSEERRVMYVALTRAKESILLINRLKKESKFIHELKEMANEKKLNIQECTFGDIIKVCPKCNSAMTIERNWKKNFKVPPRIDLICMDCKYRELPPCLKCKQGYLYHKKINNKHLVSCNNEACDNVKSFYSY
tara:strand:- start:86 stop:2656 length:2571 start_codon:yes stop_codon:yes gene_type:complete